MARFGQIITRSGFNTGSLLAAALKVIATNFGLLEPAVVVSGAADYVPALNEGIISRSRASAQTLTLPANATIAHPIGTEIKVAQSGAGALTIAPAVGVTINVIATKTLVCAGQFGVVRLVKIATNVWNASGDLTAA